VEAALVSHEAVLEAAVVGHEDDSRLIKPKAFVVLKEGQSPSESLKATMQQHIKDIRALQVPSLDRIRERVAENGDRQDPALQAPRVAVSPAPQQRNSVASGSSAV